MSEGPPNRGIANHSTREHVFQYLFVLLMWFISLPLWPRKYRGAAMRLVGFKIAKSSRVDAFCHINDRGVVFGEHFYCNIGCYLEGRGGLIFADHVRLGAYVKIFTTSHTIMPSIYRRDLKEEQRKPVTIGRGVWIGTGAMILPGVDVAEGCVIAAGAVVHRSTKPNGLYAGVPAVRKKDLPVETDRVFMGGKPV